MARLGSTPSCASANTSAAPSSSSTRCRWPCGAARPGGGDREISFVFEAEGDASAPNAGSRRFVPQDLLPTLSSLASSSEAMVLIGSFLHRSLSFCVLEVTSLGCPWTQTASDDRVTIRTNRLARVTHESCGRVGIGREPTSFVIAGLSKLAADVSLALRRLALIAARVRRAVKIETPSRGWRPQRVPRAKDAIDERWGQKRTDGGVASSSRGCPPPSVPTPGRRRPTTGAAPTDSLGPPNPEHDFSDVSSPALADDVSDLPCRWPVGQCKAGRDQSGPEGRQGVGEGSAVAFNAMGPRAGPVVVKAGQRKRSGARPAPILVRRLRAGVEVQRPELFEQST